MEGIVLETFISFTVKKLLNKIVSGAFEDKFKIMKLDVSLLKQMKSKLVKLRAVFQNAEEKRITANLTFVENWLDTLRYAVFEIDSLFDEIKTEALRCEVQVEPATSQVVKILSSPFKRFKSGVINSKLQNLIQRLEDSILSSIHVWYGAQSSSVVIGDKSCIYGRDDDKKKLKHLLLSSDGNDRKIRVISIVGMGGIGKSTLAKLLYNDPEVDDNFEFKLWADISSIDFDIFSIFETILKSIVSQTIYPNLLLVLDNVSDVQSINWIYLIDIFNAAKIGSRIIVTARDERVTTSMQYSPYVHYLRPLECESCWSLIANHAFGACNYQQLSNLEEIGREIAKKCGGLPLIALALGTLLHTNISPNYWNYVLETNIWELRDDKVQAALQLSYSYLSAPLKLCFAYCSTFPKKSILEKKMVVQSWIAEDLVESVKVIDTTAIYC